MHWNNMHLDRHSKRRTSDVATVGTASVLRYSTGKTPSECPSVFDSYQTFPERPSPHVYIAVLPIPWTPRPSMWAYFKYIHIIYRVVQNKPHSDSFLDTM